MQHETHSHGMNMAALGRDKQDLNLANESTCLDVPGLSLYYGDKQALFDVKMSIPRQRVTAFIGPSGCGKSTLLRTFNRMFELYPEQRAEGQILLDGEDVLTTKEDVSLLRARVGMVFQKPNPFPKSIYENIAFGVRLFENLSRVEMDELLDDIDEMNIEE